MAAIEPKTYKVFQRAQLEQLPEVCRLTAGQRLAIKAVSAVLPFRVNNYVVENLIDWGNIPDDPMFQLLFPQEGMLATEDFRAMADLVRAEAPAEQVRVEARAIQMKLNPHPAGQVELNVPKLGDSAVPGVQHKYRDTVLLFPSEGQTCHSFCSYCFRWAQFVGLEDLKFANREAGVFTSYLHRHPEVSDVLFTGGDPLTMRTTVLRRYVEPLLTPELAHINTIRIGTKATAFWPYRFVTDSDADDLMRLFEQIVQSGRHLAIMCHYSHPRELETPVAQAALRRILSTGAVVRCQAPLIRRVNDNPEVWNALWRAQVRLGAIPYYMFVERDTGPKSYFEVPLAEGLDIFQRATASLSGLGQTVRGPVMSATPGKVHVVGVTELQGEKVFALKFQRARNPAWLGRLFFARYDAKASWLDHLRPAFGQERFFFEEGEPRAQAQNWLPPLSAATAPPPFA